MLKNTVYSTNPKTIHCPQCKLNDPFLKSFILELQRSKIETKTPKELHIISWDDNIKDSILKQSLDMLNIQATFLGDGIIWDSNVLKISLTNNFLKTAEKKYIMGIDSHDALFVGSPEDILNKFKSMSCKLLFNATLTSYPPVPKLTNYESAIFSKKIWKHLNAGVWIGEIDYCRYFFGKLLSYQEQAKKLYSHQLEESKMGEQILVRLAFIDEHPLVSIDWKCEVFQIVREFEVYPQELKINRGIEINGKLFGHHKMN